MRRKFCKTPINPLMHDTYKQSHGDKILELDRVNRTRMDMRGFSERHVRIDRKRNRFSRYRAIKHSF